jgi:hypothetical protein
MENRFIGGRERLQKRMYINEEEKDTWCKEECTY